MDAGKTRKAQAYRIEIAGRAPRLAMLFTAIILLLLALLPAFAGRNLIQDLIFLFYMLALAQCWNLLAGLPPQIGIYGYMLGGIGYALLGSSRQLAVGPTSAISLMIAAAVGPLAAGDEVRYAQVASVAALRSRCSA